MTGAITAFVVDHDRATREATQRLIVSLGIRAIPFDSAESFLEEYPETHPSVLLCSIHLPGLSGPDLLKVLAMGNVFLPAILVAERPDVRTVVDGLRSGAVTVLERPFKENGLQRALQEAVAGYGQKYGMHCKQKEMRSRFESLTESERDVLNLIIAGKRNKDVARELNVSVRTVELRRHSILKKMDAESFVPLACELVVYGPSEFFADRMLGTACRYPMPTPGAEIEPNGMCADQRLTEALYEVYRPRFELLTKFGYDYFTDQLEPALIALEKQLGDKGPEADRPAQSSKRVLSGDPPPKQNSPVGDLLESRKVERTSLDKR